MYVYIYIYIYPLGSLRRPRPRPRRRRRSHRRSLAAILFLSLSLSPSLSLYIYTHIDVYACICLYICVYTYYIKYNLTHSLTVAIPPGGGVGGAAHNRSCVHSRVRPQRLYVHRRLEPVFLSWSLLRSILQVQVQVLVQVRSWCSGGWCCCSATGRCSGTGGR